MTFPIYGKIKKCSTPPTRLDLGRHSKWDSCSKPPIRPRLKASQGPDKLHLHLPKQLLKSIGDERSADQGMCRCMWESFPSIFTPRKCAFLQMIHTNHPLQMARLALFFNKDMCSRLQSEIMCNIMAMLVAINMTYMNLWTLSQVFPKSWVLRNNYIPLRAIVEYLACGQNQ